MRVELILFKSCPNVEDARARLRHAFSALKTRPEWQEWDRNDPASPEYARAYGSPTILVDGKDVVGVPPTEGAACCRIYSTSSGRFAGIPDEEQIVEALRSAGETRNPACTGAGKDAARRWTASLGVVPAVAVAMLPNITCPACWPAYTALLSSLGISFLPTNRFVLPLTLGAITFALLMFAWQARRRGRYGPLLLATVGALVLLAGRLVLQAQGVFYGGVVMLVAASAWNLVPVRRQTSPGPLTTKRACPTCQPTHSAKESFQSNPLDSGLGSGV